MRSVVYTPEYLGSQPVITEGLKNPYQLAIFIYLTLGGLSARDERKIIPNSDLEIKDAICATTACRDSIEQAISGYDEDSNDPRVTGLRTALEVLHSNSMKNNGLYNNSYSFYNEHTQYGKDRSTRIVEELPTGLRSFVMRATVLNTRISEAPTGRSFRRYTSIDDLHSEFPGLKVAKAEFSSFEHRILQAIHGACDLPVSLTAKQADLIISLVGGGTLLNALLNSNSEKTEIIDEKIIELAQKVERTMGRGAFRLTTLGRTAWGVHSIRLRSGDTIPRVTLPKPGV